MKRELANFKVTPTVVASEVMTEIHIAPRGDHAKFDDTKTYTVRFVPMEESIEPRTDDQLPFVEVKPQDGCLVFSHNFPGEQMHLLRVMVEGKTLYNFRIYSLLPDLYKKRPYKGDLHVHSYHSDGREEPGVVVANYRKKGYDFLAITDHGQWQPSKEAIEKYKDIPTDVQLFYGEEIHVQGGYIHAINFGGHISVNEYFHANQEQCLEEAEALSKTFDKLPDGVDALDYARRCWIAEQIHRGGGLAVFVHPHWMNNAFNVPDKMTEYIFETGVYDAFELLGGQSVFENNMQTLLYYEQRAKGNTIPVVASSDSHGTEPARWFDYVYTIVFAEDLELETLKNSIKEQYSVAVENYPSVKDIYGVVLEQFPNQEKRVHGSYRMAKYGLFLVNEYFPLYEELCFEQGRLMKEAVTGDGEAIALLQMIKGRTDRFAKEFFGR